MKSIEPHGNYQPYGTFKINKQISRWQKSMEIMGHCMELQEYRNNGHSKILSEISDQYLSQSLLAEVNFLMVLPSRNSM